MAKMLRFCVHKPGILLLRFFLIRQQQKPEQRIWVAVKAIIVLTVD